MTSVTRPRSAFLGSIRTALLRDFEAELVLASKYAVLQAAGYRRSEITKMLDAPPAALRAAELRVKRAAERLDHGND
jgi:hypothetical protein